MFRAPEIHEDMYDIVLYLAENEQNGSKICFKRIKAVDLLDVKGKKFNIESYLLEEDKSLDKLDDE